MVDNDFESFDTTQFEQRAEAYGTDPRFSFKDAPVPFVIDLLGYPDYPNCILILNRGCDNPSCCEWKYGFDS